eukprot:1161873-Pelagomonas_calceolata.AAC.2
MRAAASGITFSQLQGVTYRCVRTAAEEKGTYRLFRCVSRSPCSDEFTLIVPLQHKPPCRGGQTL